MKIIFDVKHLYYLPQYLPVIAELKKAGIATKCVFHKDGDAKLAEICQQAICKEKLEAVWCDNWQQAKEFYLNEKAEWIVFGNAVEDIELIHSVSKTVMMLHGIGPKAVYYDMPKEPMTVRFVEGQYRLNRLQKMHPNNHFIDTGYAKLDPAINKLIDGFSLADLGLDPNKKTVLYAPTFYPSSIELMPKQLPATLKDYNLIVKPHFFSLTKPKYSTHQKILRRWEKANNVFVCGTGDYNLTPFMTLSDAMISDASSAIFEFAALDKPVVWCDFYKLRWSYRGIFKFRLKQRVDDDIQYFEQVGWKVSSPNELLNALNNALNEPQSKQAQRREIVEKLAGRVDGRCSERIVEYFLNN